MLKELWEWWVEMNKVIGFALLGTFMFLAAWVGIIFIVLVIVISVLNIVGVM